MNGATPLISHVPLCCASIMKFFTFVCSAPIFDVASVVSIKCIYSCHYEDTAYTLFICLCMYQWYDNYNHDLPQHVRRHLKCRNDVDGNEYRSICVFISFLPVTDIFSMCTSHYMLFPILLLDADSFWISQ